MGRFHRHDDETGHGHGHGHGHDHDHPHDEHLGDHSGYETGADRIVVLERIFDENDRRAAENRRVLDDAGVLTINLMSSPGAGKTTLLERTLRTLPAPERVGVIEGDIETSIDADRLAAAGARVSLLNTADGFGGECHLDAPMVADALGRLDLDGLDVLFVENVGNLVCPAEFDVGAHRSVMIYAITEGEEKPLKYPVMFRAVDVVLVNKLDLLPHLDFDLDLFRANLATVNPGAEVIELSARSGEGLEQWTRWIDAARSQPATSGA
ncbi:hydrogenase nickel incorporation protein HypB [Nocardioides sp. J9]|uniref:hydrogenase nickel incorporation protein HypB n=1 Tax=unclassified Nocardioides TaxID=2615069 RepID=UPI00048C37CA|nr:MULTISPECIES: hydrogenase nickel incorporation protein HypB [unclassified Nocardioides]TWG92776.1 hydrogenase nickel incorporation protein HypB [Nocardioides sp. J9]